MEDQRKYGKHLRVGLLVMEPIRRAGLTSIFEEMRGIDLVVADQPSLFAGKNLDLVLVSLMTRADILAVIEHFKAELPSVRVIVMSSENDDDSIKASISYGAKGYLGDTATPEQVWQAVEVVASGSIWAPRRVLSEMVNQMLGKTAHSPAQTQPHFTQREMEVLRLLVSARSNREIALTLGIEVRTVKAYVGRLMRKVGAGNRTALSIHATTHDLLGSE